MLGTRNKEGFLKVRPASNWIDAATVRSAYNMVAVVEAELGRPHRRGAHPVWCCPFHSEDTPSFTVYRDHAHCFGCGWHGDVIKWTMSRRGVAFAEACRLLSPADGKAGNVRLPGNGKHSQVEAGSGCGYEQDIPSLPEAPPDKWQNAALSLIAEAEGTLWDTKDPNSARVRHYLESRGLNEATLQTYMIGYNATEHTLTNLGLWVPVGITIPFWYEAANTLYGLNVRLSTEARARWKADTGRDAKYLLARGSKRASWPGDGRGQVSRLCVGGGV